MENLEVIEKEGPILEWKARHRVGGLSNTHLIMNNSFWVGVYPGLTDEMIDYVIEVFALFSGLRRADA